MTVKKFDELHENYKNHLAKIDETRDIYNDIKNTSNKQFHHYMNQMKQYFKYLWMRASLKLLHRRYLKAVERKKRFTLSMVGEVWWKKAISKTFQYLFLAIILFVIIFPFYWMITTSFKPFSDVDPTVKETFWPKHWTVDAYKKLFQYVSASGQTEHVSVGLFFGNSIYIALISTICEMVVSLLGGFAIYNWKTKFNKAFMIFMFALIMVPGEAMLLGRFIFAIQLGWKDSVFALVVPFIGNVYTVYLFSSAFSAMSPDLKKAAKIDGLSTFKFFWKIAIPAIKSAIVTSIIISFISAWNSTLWPVMIMTNNSKHATIPMLLYGMLSITGADISQDLASIQNPINFKMAASVISIVPILAIFIVFNRPIIKGLTSKSLNGAKG